MPSLLTKKYESGQKENVPVRNVATVVAWYCYCLSSTCTLDRKLTASLVASGGRRNFVDSAATFLVRYNLLCLAKVLLLPFSIHTVPTSRGTCATFFITKIVRHRVLFL
jgi:hypothetical protein